MGQDEDIDGDFLYSRTMYDVRPYCHEESESVAYWHLRYACNCILSIRSESPLYMSVFVCGNCHVHTHTHSPTIIKKGQRKNSRKKQQERKVEKTSLVAPATRQQVCYSFINHVCSPATHTHTHTHRPSDERTYRQIDKQTDILTWWPRTHTCTETHKHHPSHIFVSLVTENCSGVFPFSS